MKNIFIYYLAILLPIPLLIWSLYNNSITFFIILMFNVVYRGFIDGQRLVEKKIINKKDLWKAFMPFWKFKYFRSLYFEK